MVFQNIALASRRYRRPSKENDDWPMIRYRQLASLPASLESSQICTLMGVAHRSIRNFNVSIRQWPPISMPNQTPRDAGHLILKKPKTKNTDDKDAGTAIAVD